QGRRCRGRAREEWALSFLFGGSGTMALSFLTLWLFRLQRLVRRDGQPRPLLGRKPRRRPDRFQLLVELLEDRLPPGTFGGTAPLDGDPLQGGTLGSSQQVLGGTTDSSSTTGANPNDLTTGGGARADGRDNPGTDPGSITPPTDPGGVPVLVGDGGAAAPPDGGGAPAPRGAAPPRAPPGPAPLPRHP